MTSLLALGRVAWRDIARHRLRSTLVVALILLPVAAMVAGIAILRTTQPSQERRDLEQMGRADLVAQGVSESELAEWIPGGSVVEPTFWTDGQLLVEGARPLVNVRGIVLDGLGEGMLTLVEGRAPNGPRETAVSASVARMADAGIGGSLTLDDGPALTVVGFVENGLNLHERLVVLDPRAALAGGDEFASWLIGLPEGVDPEAVVASTYEPETGVQRFSLYSRQSGRLVMLGGDTMSTYVLVLGTLALVEAALVASAAFAVSIRRRQRDLGLLAATGATPRQLAGTVLLGAAILGIVACIGGVIAGLGIAFGLSPFLDELTGQRNPPVIVDATGLMGPMLIGLVAAIIAAIVPARSAARLPVLVSLSGRRPPEVGARRNLRVGLAVVVVSVALTLLGANLRIDGISGIRELLVIAGAVLGTLGFGACAPWLLERLDALAVRLPLASRIAFRDAARARSRTSPIVTAVLASVAATITLGTFTASRDAENADDYRPYLHANQLAVRGAASEAVGRELLDAAGAVDGAPMTYLAAEEPDYFVIEVPNGFDAAGQLIRWGDDRQYTPTVDNVMIATPELLTTARAEAAKAAIDAGKIVILSQDPMTTDAVDVVIATIANDGTETARRVSYPASVIATGVSPGALPGALVSQEVADELGLVTVDAQAFVVTLDHPVTQADVDAAAVVAGRSLDTFVDASLGPQRPDASFRLLIIVFALLFAVSITSVAIALGEAESRPEQRSLLALGADPGLRRRIVASRAAVLALLAGCLAVPAGLLPAWGLLASLGLSFAVPTIEIAGALVALPLVAVVGAWVLSRPIPDWSAFRSARPGE